MNVVTTDIIKGSLREFDHKQGEIEDNRPGREEIIKKADRGGQGAVNTSGLDGRSANFSKEPLS